MTMYYNSFIITENMYTDWLFRVAVSTSYGFGVFDLVRSKTVYASAVSVPSGNFVCVNVMCFWLKFIFSLLQAVLCARSENICIWTAADKIE